MTATKDPQREAEMREAFEAWLTESGRGHQLARCPDRGWYIDLETYGRWCSFERGWQAATGRASAREAAMFRKGYAAGWNASDGLAVEYGGVADEDLRQLADEAFAAAAPEGKEAG